MAGQKKKRKTRSPLETAALILFPSSMAVAVTCYLIVSMGSPGRSSASMGYPQYVSMRDADGDGIDDQTDLLRSARSYLATSPRYKSKYYETGYPDDGYGVCTDVLAFAMLGAGYDLMTLVHEDILAHPEDYDIETPDINIDFRRVRNLRVYLRRHAISLTTDPSDTRQWQGGDIVMFHEHVGIVSDLRNERGVPFVLHLAGSMQLKHEEDILEKRDDITDHFRLN